MKGISNTLQILKFVRLIVDEIVEGRPRPPHPGIKCGSEIAWCKKVRQQKFSMTLNVELPLRKCYKVSFKCDSVMHISVHQDLNF